MSSRSSKNNVVITAESLLSPHISNQKPVAPQQKQPQLPIAQPTVAQPTVVVSKPVPSQQVLETKEVDVQLPIKKLPVDLKKITQGDVVVAYTYVPQHNYIAVTVNGHPIEKIDVKPFNGNVERISKYATTKCAQIKAQILADKR